MKVEIEDVEATEVTGIAEPETQEIAPVAGEPSIERMMELAITQGGEKVLEVIERLTALKNAQEDREAKKEFDRNFAKMQAEFVVARKAKPGHEYMYATLGQLETHFGQNIADNGFSYWFEGEMIADKENWKRVTMHVTGWGHERTNHFDVPPVKRTGIMNEVQALGAADTYGERYTFIAGFGLPIQDAEDNDAMTFEAGVKYADYINAIEIETDLDVLADTVKGYRSQMRKDDDKIGFEVVTKAYEQRSAELKNG